MATQELFFEGKSIEAAVEKAAAGLGLDKDMLSYEVVQTATKGIFGIGATPAKIKIVIEGADEPEQIEKTETAPEKEKAEDVRLPQGFAPEKISKKQGGGKKAPAPAPAPVVIERKLSPLPQDDKNAPVIKDFLLGLLEKLGIENGGAEISLDENGSYYVNLSGSKMGVLIGRRGETLDAVQYLANLVVNRKSEQKTRVVLDSEDYRAKRAATLVALANKTADKALKYRKNQSLEPMGSYERRIIHAALSGREHITTYSVGTDPRRKVIVAYTK